MELSGSILTEEQLCTTLRPRRRSILRTTLSPECSVEASKKPTSKKVSFADEEEGKAISSVLEFDSAAKTELKPVMHSVCCTVW